MSYSLDYYSYPQHIRDLLSTLCRYGGVEQQRIKCSNAVKLRFNIYAAVAAARHVAKDPENLAKDPSIFAIGNLLQKYLIRTPPRGQGNDYITIAIRESEIFELPPALQSAADAHKDNARAALDYLLSDDTDHSSPNTSQSS